MDKEQIDSLSDLEKAATPAPWFLTALNSDYIIGYGTEGDFCDTFDAFDCDKFEENMILAAAARNALPHLLNHIIHLRASLAHTEQEILLLRSRDI